MDLGDTMYECIWFNDPILEREVIQKQDGNIRTVKPVLSKHIRGSQEMVASDMVLL